MLSCFMLSFFAVFDLLSFDVLSLVMASCFMPLPLVMASCFMPSSLVMASCFIWSCWVWSCCGAAKLRTANPMKHSAIPVMSSLFMSSPSLLEFFSDLLVHCRYPRLIPKHYESFRRRDDCSRQPGLWIAGVGGAVFRSGTRIMRSLPSGVGRTETRN